MTNQWIPLSKSGEMWQYGACTLWLRLDGAYWLCSEPGQPLAWFSYLKDAARYVEGKE